MKKEKGITEIGLILTTIIMLVLGGVIVAIFTERKEDNVQNNEVIENEITKNQVTDDQINVQNNY